MSPRWNWDSPTPFAAGECAPRLRLKGWGSPNSNEGTYTVVLYINKYFVCRSLSRYDKRNNIVLDPFSLLYTGT